jgi:2-polyprenyl-6-methoxyphenol hydroxylase-like FAD-dependent oxidoreductase
MYKRIRSQIREGVLLMMTTDYDVIIVGGRVAGANLATRLGMYGMRVLILERSEMPSLPAVSSPIIYVSALEMLDEIGALESEYAENTPKIYHMSTVNSAFSARFRIPMVNGRDYAYAIDRARFDYGVWKAALRQPNVTGYTHASVMDLTFDEHGAVNGVIVKLKNEEPKPITAKVVIGADGRFSMVARKANAKEYDRHEDNPTSIYYAYWQGVELIEGEATAVAYEADGTFGYLVMDSADGQTVVCMEGRAEVLDPQSGETENFYMEMLQRNPNLWARLENAERVTSIRGMRYIGNSYRQPGGAGWALVGDAFHQKDPLDGQGIFDAIYTGKVLALAMRKWWQGKISWDEAMQAYEQVVHMKTYPMYKSLQARVKTSFYSSTAIALPIPLPSWVSEKVAQWVTEDGQISDLMGKMITRQLPPDMITLFAPPILIGAIARGSLREAQKRLKEVVPFA